MILYVQIAFVSLLPRKVVTGATSLDPIASSLLYPEELAVYSASRKGRQVIMTKIRQLAAKADLSMEQFISMESMIQQTWKSAGDAVRVKFQAMPQSVTLVCTGFVLVSCWFRFQARFFMWEDSSTLAHVLHTDLVLSPASGFVNGAAGSGVGLDLHFCGGNGRAFAAGERVVVGRRSSHLKFVLPCSLSTKWPTRWRTRFLTCLWATSLPRTNVTSTGET